MPIQITGWQKLLLGQGSVTARVLSLVTGIQATREMSPSYL